MNYTNIFNRSLRVFPEAQFRSALREGKKLYDAVMTQSFRSVDSETLLAFFKDVCTKRNPHGYVDLYPCGLSDATEDVRLLPTYAVLAIGIWLMNTAPKQMSADARTSLSELNTAAFAPWIMGDGADISGVLDFLQVPFRMLASVDTKAFLEAFPGLCPEMEAFLSNCIPQIRAGAEDSSESAVLMRRLIEAWDHNEILIFVYGTLMSGQRASGYLDGSELIGRYCLHDYAMYNLGAYPGIVPQEGETVIGEVWRVPAERLPELDAYEGEGSLYHRRTVTVEREGRCVPAQAYIYAHRPTGELMREPWGSKGSDRVWYAAYGSNLSAERFACYIQGGTCKENGKSYDGCADKTLWSDSCLRDYPGRMYFGQKSGSWDGKGVAFYDPSQPGETHMRLYQISRAQLHEVQAQEGHSPSWYGKLVTLGIHEDGCPIYTFTSEKHQEHNMPSDAYLNLIRTALIGECGLSVQEADTYLHICRAN